MLPKFIKAARIVFSKKDETPVTEWVEINGDSKRVYENYFIPKKIWIFWHSANVPNIVKACIRQASEMCIGYEIIVLNTSNIDEFIDIPHIYADVPISNKADLIRLMLLEKYGGIWMDASIFLTESLDWIISMLDRHEAFLFYSDECTSDTKRPISENWLIACPKESDFIKNWKDEFYKCITSNSPKTYYDNLENRGYHLQKLTRPDYLLCYISAIVVLSNTKYNILYTSSGSTGHYLNYKHQWNGIGVAIELLLRNKSRLARTRLIKLNSSSRAGVETLMKMKLINNNSILGSFFNK